MANGLDEKSALARTPGQFADQPRLDGFTLLAGIECEMGRRGPGATSQG